MTRRMYSAGIGAVCATILVSAGLLAQENPYGEEMSPEQQQMMQAWINFARTGDPAHQAIGPWPAYGPEKRATMIFGPETGLTLDPLPEERKILSR